MEWLKDKYIRFVDGTTVFEGLVVSCETYQYKEESQIPADWEINDEAAAKYQRRCCDTYESEPTIKLEIKIRRRFEGQKGKSKVETKYIQLNTDKIPRIEIRPEIERMFFKIENDL